MVGLTSRMFCKKIILILGSVAAIALATSPVRIPCDDSNYSPCKCTNEFKWSEDVNPITCDGVAVDDMKKVLQTVLAESKGRIFIKMINKNLKELPQSAFGDVPIHSATFQLENLRNIHEDAFLGQEDSLEYLTFDGCSLSAIPTRAVSRLQRLSIFEYTNSTVKMGDIRRSTFAGMNSAQYVQQLKLGKNGIKNMQKDALKMFTNVIYLDLNDNDLSYISADSLPPKTLDNLELSGNNFRQIPVNLFSKLNKRSDINLRHNEISRITGKVLKLSLKNKIGVNLYGNSLTCDCKFKMLMEYLEEHPNENTISGKCVWPSELKGKDVFALTLSEFSQCPDSDCFIF